MNQDVISCPSCHRPTGVARGRCIYCGAPLPVSKIETAPPQRNIQASDQAFNTVLNPTPSASESSIESLAGALKIEADEAGAMVRAAKPIPISRCQSAEEAEMIAGLTRNSGLNATVVPDAELRLDVELVRARKLTLTEGVISVYHSGGAMEVKAGEVKLFVMGGLKRTQIDYSEALGGGRAKSGGLTDTSEYITDETLLDVYCSRLERSFRIKADAFDYSGLVNPLSFRAEVNFKQGLERLANIAPQARVDVDFGKVRNLLARAWPERSHMESRGIKRAGFSFKPVSRQTIIRDNSDQFERYSRLIFLYG